MEHKDNVDWIRSCMCRRRHMELVRGVYMVRCCYVICEVLRSSYLYVCFGISKSHRCRRNEEKSRDRLANPAVGQPSFTSKIVIKIMRASGVMHVLDAGTAGM